MLTIYLSNNNIMKNGLYSEQSEIFFSISLTFC